MTAIKRKKTAPEDFAEAVVDQEEATAEKQTQAEHSTPVKSLTPKIPKASKAGPDIVDQDVPNPALLWKVVAALLIPEIVPPGTSIPDPSISEFVAVKPKEASRKTTFCSWQCLNFIQPRSQKELNAVALEISKVHSFKGLDLSRGNYPITDLGREVIARVRHSTIQEKIVKLNAIAYCALGRIVLLLVDVNLTSNILLSLALLFSC